MMQSGVPQGVQRVRRGGIAILIHYMKYVLMPERMRGRFQVAWIVGKPYPFKRSSSINIISDSVTNSSCAAVPVLCRLKRRSISEGSFFSR